MLDPDAPNSRSIVRQSVRERRGVASWTARASAPGIVPCAASVSREAAWTSSLIALRTARLKTRPRVAPAPGLPMQQRLAQGTHHLLYLLMVLVPLSGFLGSVWSKYPIRCFGVALPRLAEPWEAGKAAMSSVHSTTTTVLMVLVALHLLGVLYHQFIRRDGLLQRMR